MVVCSLCGASPPPKPSTDPVSTDQKRPGAGLDDVPLSWVRSVENGATRAYCDRCAREHVRSIEAKLDASYW
jgi:hypothetical protein